MCIGNRADSSAHYINSQLGAFYENAIRCTEKHSTGLKPDRSEVEYSTCLYEFYGPGRHNRYQPSVTDLSFFAKFGRPRLEFVCNHEVILFLEILEGHYNLDYTKSASKHDIHERFEDHTVAFRIDFSTHSIKDFHCGEIGNGQKYTMGLHVLDMDSATLVEEHSRLPFLDHQPKNTHYTRERKLSALTHYLQRHYLQVLKRAGLHVLHALPDFDNLGSTTTHVDYSVISKRTLSTDNLFGIRVEDINAYLTGLWLQATGWIDEHGLDWSGPEAYEHTHKHFLAEARTSWTDTLDDMHLHMVFGPLQVQPLCKREVILFINLQDLEVHIGAGFSENHNHSLTDLKLAYIVEIDHEVLDGGKVRNLRLDTGSARYCEHLSSFNSFYEQEIFLRIKRTLLRYIEEHYIKTIEDSGHGCVYHKDTNTPTTREIEDDEGEGEDIYDFKDDCHCEDETTCEHAGIRWGILHKRRITQTEVNGFDMISTVTQGSINAHFKSLWESASHRVHLLGEKRQTWTSHTVELESCLAEFSFVHPNHGEEVFFSASFKQPKVQLKFSEGSQKAILYLCLDKGYMRTLGHRKSLLPGSESQTFSNCRLAYEVDLQLVNSTSDSMADVVLKRFNGHSKFKQLILDLSTAKLIMNLSTVPSFVGSYSNDFRAIRRVREALVYYIQKCYFPVFQRAQHHVLYTIPMHDQEHKLGLTTLQIQIIPFDSGDGKVYQGIFGRNRAIYERNMIAFLGMFGDHEMPSGLLPRRNWVCGSGRELTPFGTVVLPREEFLQTAILNKLRKINRQTTVVPNFSGVEGGDLHLELTTWNEQENRKNAGAWTQVDRGHESLDFVWNNKVNWSYQHIDDDGESHYIVKCDTHNTVSIPTIRRETAVLLVSGKTTLGLELSGRGSDWSSGMTYAWSAAIRLQSHSRGMEVSVTMSAPKLHDAGCEHVHGKSTHAKVLADFKRVFPKVIYTEDIVNDLRKSLEGGWSGLQLHSRELIVSHPVFNRRGDLLLELGFRSAPVVGEGRHHMNGKVEVDSVSLNGNSRHFDHKAEGMGQIVATPHNFNRPSSLLHKNSKTLLRPSTVSRNSSRNTSAELHDNIKQRYFSSNSTKDYEELEEDL